ncbi:MAG: hypothetical protein M5R41_12935 [Bacteroidia bacterium]|nr:hypothetical protein [Bacteroidia bacterium]
MSFSTVTSSRTYLPLTLGIVILALLRMLPLLFPEGRLWGLDAGIYLDPVVHAFLTLFLLLLALPAVQRHVAQWVDAGDRKRWSARTRVLASILFLAAILFPMGTFFYGDGGNLVSEVYKIGARKEYISDILLNLQSAPLAGGILHGLAMGIPSAMFAVGMTPPATPMFPFFALALLGVIGVYFAVRLRQDPKARFADLLLISGSAAALLFFSYVEMYLTVTVAITAFLLAGQRALRGELPRIVVVLLYVIALAAHYMTLALLPALLFLLFEKSSFVARLAGTRRALLTTWLASVGIFAILYWFLGFASSDSRIVMPLFEQRSDAGTLSYTLLSSAHLLDFVNLLLLLGSLPLLIVLASVIFRRGTMWTTERGFLLLALLYFGTFIFFSNTSLGLARDWDIAAPLSIIFVLLAAHTLSDGETGERSSLPVVLGCASLIAVLPWLFVNIDDDTAAQRFESVIQLDDEHMYGDYALSGYEALRKYYLHHGRLDEEARILYRMVDLVGYPEQYRLLLVNSIARFHTDRNASLQTQLWMLDRLGRASDAMILAGKADSYAISRWEIDSLVAVISVESITNSTMQQVFTPVKNMVDRGGLKLGHDILIGAGWYLDERFFEASEALRTVWESRFRDARVDGMYGSSLSLSGLPDIGDAVFQEASQWHGEHPQFLFFFAITQLRLDRQAGAAKTALQLALTYNPPASAREQIEEILASIPEVAPTPLPWSSKQP